MQNTLRNAIRPGIVVRVIQKQDQRSGKLTEGVVKDILTNSGQHHRGIKVRLVSGIVGRVAELVDAGSVQPPQLSTAKAVDRTKPHQIELKKDALLLSDFIPNTLAHTDPLSTWSCKACTYDNGVYSKECEMCSTPK